MAVGVTDHKALQLPDGTLLSTGGSDLNDNVVNSIQEYEPESKMWSLRQEQLLVPKAGPMTMVPDDWCNPNVLL